MKKNVQKTIAVVGVSEDSTKYGHKIFVDLSKKGYKVYGVNKKGGSVEGKDLYKSLNEIPEKVELVITVIKPEMTEKIVEECIKLKIGTIWMQPGSFSQKAIKKAKENGIIAIYNQCFMVIEGLWETIRRMES